HTKLTKGCIDRHGKLGGKPKLLARVAVLLLDATLGVQAGATHIPRSLHTVVARLRVRPPHDPNDQLARREAAVSRSLNDLSQGLVPEDQILFARWSLTVATLDDLEIGAADTDGAAPDEKLPLRRVRRCHVQHLS